LLPPPLDPFINRPIHQFIKQDLWQKHANSKKICVISLQQASFGTISTNTNYTELGTTQRELAMRVAREKEAGQADARGLNLAPEDLFSTMPSDSIGEQQPCVCVCVLCTIIERLGIFTCLAVRFWMKHI
jgi:hypothetical protein